MRIQRGKSDRGEGERAKRALGHPLSLLPAHEKSPALPETSNPTMNRYRPRSGTATPGNTTRGSSLPINPKRPRIDEKTEFRSSASRPTSIESIGHTGQAVPNERSDSPSMTRILTNSWGSAASASAAFEPEMPTATPHRRLHTPVVKPPQNSEKPV